MKKMLTMTILMIALFAAGYLKANSENAPWAALAEESAVTEAAGMPEIGSKEIWNMSYLEAIDHLHLDNVSVSRVNTGAGEFTEVLSEDVAVSCFNAEKLCFMYHDNALCTYSYFMKKDCNAENFDYILQALKGKYGTPTRKSFALEKLSACAAFRTLDEYYEELTSPADIKVEWGNEILRQGVQELLSTPTEMYEWKIGNHTQISAFYCDRNTILGHDWCFIVYTNLQPHGEAVQLEEGDVFSTNGL